MEKGEASALLIGGRKTSKIHGTMKRISFYLKYLSVVLTVIACNLTFTTLKDWFSPLQAASTPCVQAQREVLRVRLEEVEPMAFRNIYDALPITVRAENQLDPIPVRVTNRVAIED